MMKVLYVLDTLKQRSGVTSVVLNYYHYFPKGRVKVDFLLLPDSEDMLIKEITQLGGSVFFMPRLTLFSLCRFRRFVNQFFSAHFYDVVHSHFNQLDGIVFPIAKKYGVHHCISHSHNTKYSDYRLRAIRNWLMCLPIKRDADIWAACSIMAGEFLYGKEFLQSSKHLIINNAINVDAFCYNQNIRSEMRQSLGVLPSQVVIGTVGNLKPQKNHVYLLKIFSSLLQIVEDKEKYVLHIVSDGVLRNYLEQLAKDLSISAQVKFLGQRDDINRLLQAMDIFVLPSLYEGLPVVGIEAQTAGLPCLFSDTITKEVDVCNVRFLPLRDDVSEWVKAIVELENYPRFDVSKIIIEKGFNINTEADKLINFYEQLNTK